MQELGINTLAFCHLRVGAKPPELPGVALDISAASCHRRARFRAECHPSLLFRPFRMHLTSGNPQTRARLATCMFVLCICSQSQSVCLQRLLLHGAYPKPPPAGLGFWVSLVRSRAAAWAPGRGRNSKKAGQHSAPSSCLHHRSPVSTSTPRDTQSLRLLTLGHTRGVSSLRSGMCRPMCPRANAGPSCSL